MTKYKINILFAVNNEQQKKLIIKRVLQDFKGYSIAEQLGGWSDVDGNIIQETSYKLTLIDEQPKGITISKICKFIKEVANQQEVWTYTDKIKLKII